jgi:cobalt-zinc-cadmium resistance protein CzcA
MERSYKVLLEAVLRHPRKLFTGAGLALALSLATTPLIGTEFIAEVG